MALNDVLKMQAFDSYADGYVRLENSEIFNLENNRLLNVPPFQNVSKKNDE